MLNLSEKSNKNQTRIKLLIIDDNEQMRRMTRFYLQDSADEIRECEDGEMSFEIFEEFLPDWVLIEVYLKKTDGFKAIRKIREAHPQAKIIVVTNYTDDQTRQAAVAAGAVAFFGKDDLMDLVSWLKQMRDGFNK